MNTKSLYIINENGKTFCFSSDYAGGFSYPFQVADFLEKIQYGLRQSFVQKGLCVAPMLAQMVGDYHFPDELKGKELFQAITIDKAEAMRQSSVVLFDIDIDMDRGVIGYHFNLEEENLCDVEVPVYGEISAHGGKAFRNAMDCHMVTDMFRDNNTPLWKLAEQAAKEVIEKAASEQQTLSCQHMG